VNALELDFDRFEFLAFSRICITTFNKTCLEIIKGPDGKIRILLNGALTSLTGDYAMLSAAEIVTLRTALGPRPAYLPAFRSVLERVRNDYMNPYREQGKEGETEAIANKEFSLIKEVSAARERDNTDARALREEATITARKTVQCRQWFGAFVPIVRYPSILEADDGLTAEWRSAQLTLAQREHSMFADVFAKVFRTVVGLEKSKVSDASEDNLLTSISQFLSETDSQTGVSGPSPIYGQLLEAANFLKKKNERDTNDVARSVLQLYTETLSDRKNARTKAFQNSRDFETSINKFLDKKKLRIGEVAGRTRFRSAVNVGTDGGRYYGLGSLSSGEKQILTMLYSASRSRLRKGIFLIDEPELSLHVDWQRQILAELMQQAPDCQIIACTHSPEVGADHLNDTQDFEPKSSKERSQTNDLFDIDNLEE
jgi:hypothetical protein